MVPVLPAVGREASCGHGFGGDGGCWACLTVGRPPHPPAAARPVAHPAVPQLQRRGSDTAAVREMLSALARAASSRDLSLLVPAELPRSPVDAPTPSQPLDSGFFEQVDRFLALPGVARELAARNAADPPPPSSPHAAPNAAPHARSHSASASQNLAPPSRPSLRRRNTDRSVRFREEVEVFILPDEDREHRRAASAPYLPALPQLLPPPSFLAGGWGDRPDPLARMMGTSLPLGAGTPRDSQASNAPANGAPPMRIAAVDGDSAWSTTVGSTPNAAQREGGPAWAGVYGSFPRSNQKAPAVR
ncbi:hypothetical protein DFJ74DRAFT_718580 [Hyaloraphidium curvatum]|nr:hypothetical protein DFJ74DRAFT_718580 [Hyaloraphidium curvatum]